jgi:hypothetical protein
LRAHGFYRRTLTDIDFDDIIRVHCYSGHACKRTVSLLPQFALPYLRFAISVISRFLVARLLKGQTLEASATAAGHLHMPYQRSQFWVRRSAHTRQPSFQFRVSSFDSYFSPLFIGAHTSTW